MSDLFDDEDELPQQRGKAQVADDLFGSDDEGEAQAPVKAPSPEPAAAPAGKLDMKARLAALAAAKKKEQVRTGRLLMSLRSRLHAGQ